MTTVKRTIQEEREQWGAGELVSLKRSTTLLKEHGTDLYSNLKSSQYVCIREATEGQDGILVKGLASIRRRHFMFVGRKPFCKDERDELFVGKHYYCFPLPTADELKEVLDIVRTDADIQQKLKDNGMHFNANGTFWVSNTKSELLGLKRDLQYYDAATGRLAVAKSIDEHHQRMTIVYF